MSSSRDAVSDDDYDYDDDDDDDDDEKKTSYLQLYYTVF